jgi:hypothetical protein
VSEGLLHRFNKDEIRAVLGHEIGHVANGDMVTLALIQGVVNTFVIFASRVIGSFVDRVVFKNENGHGIGFFVVSIAAELVLGILASTIGVLVLPPPGIPGRHCRRPAGRPVGDDQRAGPPEAGKRGARPNARHPPGLRHQPWRPGWTERPVHDPSAARGADRGPTTGQAVNEKTGLCPGFLFRPDGQIFSLKPMARKLSCSDLLVPLS